MVHTFMLNAVILQEILDEEVVNLNNYPFIKIFDNKVSVNEIEIIVKYRTYTPQNIGNYGFPDEEDHCQVMTINVCANLFQPLISSLSI